MLVIESRALCLLGKLCTTEAHTSLALKLLLLVVVLEIDPKTITLSYVPIHSWRQGFVKVPWMRSKLGSLCLGFA